MELYNQKELDRTISKKKKYIAILSTILFLTVLFDAVMINVATYEAKLLFTIILIASNTILLSIVLFFVLYSIDLNKTEVHLKSMLNGRREKLEGIVTSNDKLHTTYDEIKTKEITIEIDDELNTRYLELDRDIEIHNGDKVTLELVNKYIVSCEVKHE